MPRVHSKTSLANQLAVETPSLLSKDAGITGGQVQRSSTSVGGGIQTSVLTLSTASSPSTEPALQPRKDAFIVLPLVNHTSCPHSCTEKVSCDID